MKKLTITTAILLIATVALGQGVAINEDGAAPDPSAMLEVTSNEKGILIPRMTQAQREAISAPANGLLIFQTDETSGFYFNAGTTGDPLWQRLGDEVSLPSGSDMQTLRHDGAGWVANSLLRNNGAGLGVGANPFNNTQLYLYRPTGNYGAGYANIYAIRNGHETASIGGTSWSRTGVDAAIKGFSNWGNNYSAAVAGYGYLDYPNSAAVIGSYQNGNNFGSLAFRDANNIFWAGYFKGNVNVTGTMRIQGGSPGEGKILTSDANGNATWEPRGYQVGNFAHGGVVFYVEPCGTKGLVCAIENRAAIEWGDVSYKINSTAYGIYGGKTNTSIIISVHAAHGEYYGVAARHGINYKYGGYGDWYLPSKDELNLIHQNYLTINAVSIANGGEAIHSNELYWSSTEYDIEHAWVQRLTTTGAQYATPKNNIRYVRPIRAF
jgi:hypothetical protein